MDFNRAIGIQKYPKSIKREVKLNKGMGLDREQSEFNSAISYLYRVNALLTQADESAMALDAYSWFHTLSALYREIVTEMNEQEETTLKKDLDTCAKMINHIMVLRNKGRPVVFKQELYNLLSDIEIKLRKIMKEAGLILKMKKSPEFALQ